MKIVEIKTTLLTKPISNPVQDAILYQSQRDILLAEVKTDEGLTGIGFITALGAVNASEGPVMKYCMDKSLAPLLIGKDPFAREQIWNECFDRTTRFGRKGCMIKALSALDIALWDLAGKAANLPTYRLMGYDHQNVKVYASGGYYDDKNPMDITRSVEQIDECIEAGYPAIKMKIGKLPVKQDVERVRMIRERVGDKIDIMVDANQGWDVVDAIRFCDAAKDLDLGFVEEPLIPDDYDGMKELTKRTNIPIAAGETENTKYGFHYMIQSGVKIVNNDVTRTGGITEWKKVTDYAQVYNLPVIPHAIQQIHVSLAATSKNVPMIEYFLPDHPVEEFISEFFTEIQPGMKVIDGCVRPVEVPGLALGYNTDLYKKYMVMTDIIK